MFTFIQHFLGKYVISSAIKKNRIKKIHNFQTAKTIAVVFPATDTWNMNILEDFILKVKKYNIKIYAIGWINEKELPSEFKENESLTYIIKKDLNILGMPVSEKFRNFTCRKYDILINLSLHPDIITSIIAAVTNAEMKISRDVEKTNAIFDFLIRMDDSAAQYTFFEQIIHYLNTINLPYNEA